MRRVVVTGMGIVSSLGNNQAEVLKSLQETKSGIEYCPEYKEVGMTCHIHGSVNIDIESLIERKDRRFMGPGSAYTFLAMKEAIADAGLEDTDVSNEMSGLVVGSGGTSTSNLVNAADTLRSKGIRRVGPFMVPRCMSSTLSATLATPFKILGVNYSITSACATSTHCIGNSMELIGTGKQDIVFAGGGEELHWTLSNLFDAMKALTITNNDTPTTASKPFDKNRDGFVISGGGGVLVLEEYEHAKARGAQIYAELVGYGATSDGYDMVQPSGLGAIRCMKQALKSVKAPVDYINAHGTSTPAGDSAELKSIKEVFANNIPKVSSTKSISGHSLGGAGVHEAIYTLLMMKNNFIAASANITELDEEAKGVPVVTEVQTNAKINTAISNSFGFGGTNASLVFQQMT